MHTKTFGRYQVIRPLGAGSLGVTYLAEESSAIGLVRRAAIKSFPMDWLENLGPATTSVLLQQLQDVMTWSHPNIVGLEAFAHEQGDYYVAMEYVEGMSLAALLQGGGHVPGDIVVYAVMQLLEALEHCHGHAHLAGEGPSVVHGDLAPSHLLLSLDGQVKVTGFGMGVLRRLAQSHMPGGASHRWRYRAPEQRMGAAASVAADLYAVGAILYEALSGVPVHSASRSPDLPSAHAIVPLRDHIPELLPQLEQIVHRALSDEPMHRYTSATEFLRDLESFAAPATSSQLRRNLQHYMQAHTAGEHGAWLARREATHPLIPCTNQRKPIVCVLSQDHIFTPSFCQQLSNAWGIGDSFEVQFFSDKQHLDWALEALQTGDYAPHAVLFGGLHVALSHPLLSALRERDSIQRVLLLEYPNAEVFELAINLCGVDAFLPGPVDMAALAEVLQRGLARESIYHRFSSLQQALNESRKAENDYQYHLDNLRETSEKAHQIIENLRFKNQVLGEKNRFLQRVSHAVMEPSNAQLPAGQMTFFQGQINQMRLVDLCQLMSMSQKTVVISMEHEQDEGSVFLEDGALIHAVCGPLKGRIAMSYLLRWEDGTFRVHDNKQAVERTIFQPTDQLLLDILREQDESSAASFEIALPEGDWL